MACKIALAGNPNSGKTTLFNLLTGSNQYVGNWPGVTVEKKEGRIKGKGDVTIQDLPGIYSLSPYTAEEVISRNYIVNERPDALINIVDATNFERKLYLTTQLLETGVPVVVALNMIDLVRKRGDTIDIAKLSAALGCPVVEVSALRKIGCEEIVGKAIELAAAKVPGKPIHKFSEPVEEALETIGELIGDIPGIRNTRWVAIKLFERDCELAESNMVPEEVKVEIEHATAVCEAYFNNDSESIIANERYNFITGALMKCISAQKSNSQTTSQKIDRILTNRVLALPIFAAIIFLVYYLSISSVGTMMTDWVNDTLFGDYIPNWLTGALAGAGTPDWLNSLILDGIVAGVGAVIGFLPQMLVLFICLVLLEECGYMVRIAFILDRVFRRFGLSGKSFIPMLISTGCGVPGIMASRTIESENDRRMTVITAVFMPCGAKLPIVALISGALFPDAFWVGPSVYFIGIAAVLLTGIMLKKIRLFYGNSSPFVMELPAYHIPRAFNVVRVVASRGWAFVKRAGTLVLLATVIVWFLSTFSWTMQMVESAEDSMLSSIGGAIAFIFAPLGWGWGNWQASIATLTGLLAKENVVGTLGVLYGYADAEGGAEIWPQLVASFTPIAAYSFLTFNMLCAPCFAAIGAIRREMMSAKWTLFAVGYQCVFAYAVSLCIYQIGMLFMGGGFNAGTAAAFAVVALIGFMVFKKPYRPKTIQSPSLSR